MTMTVPAGFPAARDTSAPAPFGHQSRYVPSGGGFPRISLSHGPADLGGSLADLGGSLADLGGSPADPRAGPLVVAARRPGYLLTW